jgi:signal transduction histidine kinase
MAVELPVDFPKVWADPRRIVQVLVNLIGNANKYGPADSEIELKVTKGVSEIRVAVADRGPGISPHARVDIFRRFVFPVGETAASQAGAGLGLSVVKAIVEAHGGRVGVDDRQGGGSVFWFTLPAQEVVG